MLIICQNMCDCISISPVHAYALICTKYAITRAYYTILI